MYGGCVDGTVNQVLQATASSGNHWMQPALSPNPASNAYVAGSTFYEGVRPPPKGGALPSSPKTAREPSSPGGLPAAESSLSENEFALLYGSPEKKDKEWWNPEKWMPDLFRNV